MDAHQSVVSPPLKNSSVVSELERQKSGNLSEESGVLGKEESIMVVRSNNTEGFIGVLEVYIHQARDIHNICIYQKQDVYAKLCLMNDPENTSVSTKIINGGGKNPVFNESFKLNVGTIESSLKCEVWMLSRVKNYLGDQLLGFASVPLSEILVGNGRVAHEFSLSSNDMFHSPAGFVELSLSYTGASPEVLAIPDPRRSPSAKATSTGGLQEEEDYEVPDSISSNYDKIEFPDPKIVNENEMMVSEYFGIQSPTLDTESSESLDNSETHHSDNGVRVMDCFSAANLDPIEVPKRDTPASSVSTTNGSPSVSSQSFCDTPEASKSNSDLVSATKEKNVDVPAGTETETETETETYSSSRAPSNTFAQSVLNVNIQSENLVVQQDIVDMYMKSMQQFTESLAKMKLPLDIGNRTTNSENGNSSSDQKLQASKAKDSKVFYGSRPFF